MSAGPTEPSLELAYRPSSPARLSVVAGEEGPGFVHQTWRYAGLLGDDVLAEAYLPPAGAPWGAVVAGHGLGFDRTAPYIQGASKAWARQGLLVVAPDFPFHGRRAAEGSPDEATLRDPALLERAVGDLRRLIDSALALPALAGAPFGYLGFSMGTLVGVPFMAADRRVEAGVFVVGGSTAVVAEEHALGKWDPSFDPVVFAPRVAPRPVAMLNADRDEIFSRRSALALYDAFRPPKELVFFPGTHAVWEEPGRPYQLALAFFRHRLGP